jgi:nuclear pore complex protein Nup205
MSRVGKQYSQVNNQCHIFAMEDLINESPGLIPIDGQVHDANDKFKESTLEVADDLELDELDAAQIFQRARTESQASGRAPVTCSVIYFHQRRKELLDCLRLTLEIHADVDRDEIDQDVLQDIVSRIIAPRANARYISRCLSSMKDIKTWLANLSEKQERLEVVGNEPDGETAERLEYQRVSLVKQHESLGTIVFYLAKNHAHQADFESILEMLKSMDKFNNILRKC